MIRINRAHITEEGLEVSGSEPAEILELTPDSAIPLTTDGEIRYKLRAMMVGQDLLVTGSVKIPLKTECARCLEPIRRNVGTDSICLHYEKITDQEVDITQDIREELLLSIPNYFHCSEDCLGICPGCGVNLNRESCQCPADRKEELAPPEESPWNALDALTEPEKKKPSVRKNTKNKKQA